MSKDATLRPPETVPGLVSAVRDLLAAGTELPTWTLNCQDVRAVLLDLAKLRAQVEELAARTLAHAVELGAGEETGATSTANWLAVETRQTRAAAHRQVRVAAGLSHHRPTRAALAAGQVVVEPAEVITHALDQLSRYPVDALPSAGGVAATVAVTMDLDTLLGADKAATVGDLTLAPSDARRLACEAGIIPAVLGSTSEVLDLGRTTRFHTRAQRIALAITQRTCVEPGCDVPHHLCHVHHTDFWSHGGHTDLNSSELRCPKHHRDIDRRPPEPSLRT